MFDFKKYGQAIFKSYLQKNTQIAQEQNPVDQKIPNLRQPLVLPVPQDFHSSSNKSSTNNEDQRMIVDDTSSNSNESNNRVDWLNF